MGAFLLVLYYPFKWIVKIFYYFFSGIIWLFKHTVLAGFSFVRWLTINYNWCFFLSSFFLLGVLGTIINMFRGLTKFNLHNVFTLLVVSGLSVSLFLIWSLKADKTTVGMTKKYYR